MQSLLDHIDTPADLKKIPLYNLPQVGAEMREFIINTVSDVGGHLASSLGAVEIAVCLHYVFNAPEDKIIWDVGHQAYAHKILTGRRGRFSTLRQLNGISGFPRPEESEYDAFGVGHSSTSISAALGMAAARDLSGRGYKVIAVIGDGSLTAGLAFEGLNSAGHLKKDILVVLNDNEMSISKNVGALSTFLSRKITGRLAMKLKKEAESFIKSMPFVGGRLMGIAKKAEDSLITLFTPGMLFEGLGFHYVGPIDGHDTGAVVAALNALSEVRGPILLHLLTKKGKGYVHSEEDPSAFHGVSPFAVDSGLSKKKGPLSYTSAFGSALVEIAGQDARVVAITAAMPEGTGLDRFALKFPDRFFDVGIAEQHAVTFAAGLAKEGFRPVAAIYSTFLQRAYDQIFHDVCLSNLPVVFAVDRAGIAGRDGATHHGMFDMAFLRHIPNMTVCAPKDGRELRALLYSAIGYGVPVAIRYPRGGAPGVDAHAQGTVGPVEAIPRGKAEVLREGEDVVMFAIGSMVYPALIAAEALARRGIKAGVVNCRFVKPLDAEAIVRLSSSAGSVVTVEEGALKGGFGSAVLELLTERGVKRPVRVIGVPDEFIEHGGQDELRAMLGLDASGIEKTVSEFVNERAGAGIRAV